MVISPVNALHVLDLGLSKSSESPGKTTRCEIPTYAIRTNAGVCEADRHPKQFGRRGDFNEGQGDTSSQTDKQTPETEWFRNRKQGKGEIAERIFHNGLSGRGFRPGPRIKTL